MFAAVAAFAVPAEARVVVIDGNTRVPFPPCTYGGSTCTALSTLSAPGSLNATPATGSAAISFTMDYGSGQKSDIFVYGNGLIAIGAPLTGTVQSITSLADLGQDVLTPIYDPSLTVRQDSFEYATGIENGGNEFNGHEFVRVAYSVRYNKVETKVQANIYQDGAPGDFTLLFAYGEGNGVDPLFPDSALLGYYLNGQLQQSTAGQSRTQIASGSDFNVFKYHFTAGAAGPAVPEPATWAMMILGFGMVGASLRRQGARSATATA